MNGEKADMVFTDPPYRQEGHIEAAESEAKQQKGKVRNNTKEISPRLVKHAKKLKGLLDFAPKDFINTLLTLNPVCVYIFCNKINLFVIVLSYLIDGKYLKFQNRKIISIIYFSKNFGTLK